MKTIATSNKVYIDLQTDVPVWYILKILVTNNVSGQIISVRGQIESTIWLNIAIKNYEL